MNFYQLDPRNKLHWKLSEFQYTKTFSQQYARIQIRCCNVFGFLTNNIFKQVLKAKLLLCKY